MPFKTHFKPNRAEVAAERGARSEQKRMTRRELSIADAAVDAEAAANAGAEAMEQPDTLSSGWALSTSDMQAMGSALVCANIVTKLATAASARAAIAADSPPEANVVLPVPEPAFVEEETGLVVRGICMFCAKPVTNSKHSMRGKDVASGRYFHIACNPYKPDAVQKAFNMFNTLKAARAVPGEACASQQAYDLFKRLSAAAAVDAAAGGTASASDRGPVPSVPLFNGAAGVP